MRYEGGGEGRYEREKECTRGRDVRYEGGGEGRYERERCEVRGRGRGKVREGER